MDIQDGFYWARWGVPPLVVEVVRRENGVWWSCGNEVPIGDLEVEVISERLEQSELPQ